MSGVELEELPAQLEAYEVERPKAEADVLAWASELKRQRALVDAS